jgi:hypothetical protein
MFMSSSETHKICGHLILVGDCTNRGLMRCLSAAVRTDVLYPSDDAVEKPTPLDDMVRIYRGSW